MKTVVVQKIDGHNAVQMVWQKKPLLKDIRVAFAEITRHLEENNAPLHVVVVLPKGIRFPMSHTILAALPVYQDERLASWLVVDGGSLAKAIEATLYHMARRDNVFWFSTEEDALAHLRASEVTCSQ